MAEVEVVARYRYEITDDLKKRKDLYGTEDLGECMKIDMEQADTILENAVLLDKVNWTVRPVEAAQTN